jgi:hypothetical protein
MSNSRCAHDVDSELEQERWAITLHTITLHRARKGWKPGTYLVKADLDVLCRNLLDRPLDVGQIDQRLADLDILLGSLHSPISPLPSDQGYNPNPPPAQTHSSHIPARGRLTSGDGRASCWPVSCPARVGPK